MKFHQYQCAFSHTNVTHRFIQFFVERYGISCCIYIFTWRIHMKKCMKRPQEALVTMTMFILNQITVYWYLFKGQIDSQFCIVRCYTVIYYHCRVLDIHIFLYKSNHFSSEFQPSIDNIYHKIVIFTLTTTWQWINMVEMHLLRLTKRLKGRQG